MVEFVVLSTQRSGSSFFVTSLSSHPQLQCYRELFLSKNRGAIAYRAYRTAFLGRRLAHLFRRKQLIDSYLTNLYTATNGVDAVGFKFMYGQAHKLPEVVAWLKEHDVKVIHFIRANFLKTIVSRRVAYARGIYHSTKTLDVIKVRLQPTQLKTEMARMRGLIEKYRGVFADNPYLEITYEAFVNRQDGETRRVLSFLNIDSFAPLRTDLVKINPDSLQELIENYQEVAAALKGTDFERFLDRTP